MNPSPIQCLRRRAWRMVVLLLSVTSATALFLAELPVSEQIGVRPILPERIADWIGEDLFFCQNLACLRSFRRSELHGATRCPVCGSALDLVSLPERNLLPADTVLAKKVYRNSHNESLEVSLVLSGREQKSIHRPEQCLPAQGYVIDTSRIMAVPLIGRASLRVRILRIRRPESAARPILFAYWFVGGTRETPYHSQRLAWMAWDNLAHGVHSRWAYISVAVEENPASGVPSENLLADFIRQLYPALK